MEFIEACRKFISIESSPSTGNWELVEFAAELCRLAGLYVDIQQESQNGILQANIIARPQEQIPKEEFMLETHLDTPDPGRFGLWTKTGANPFNASIYQDSIYGLGAADVKLDFLCKLEAIKSLAHLPLKTPFVLVGSFGEETGMQGALKLIRKKKVFAKRALIGEPTDLKLVHAGKGIAVVEFDIPFSQEEMDYREQHDASESSSTQSKIFVGKAAHSSHPELGDNAIRKMMDYFIKLPEGLMLMDMQGGVNYNSVPAHAVLEIDVVGSIQDAIGKKLIQIFKAIEHVEKEFKKYPDYKFDPKEPTLNIGMLRTYNEYIRISGCCRTPLNVTSKVFEEWMHIINTACSQVGAQFKLLDYKQAFQTNEKSEFVQICQSELRKMGLNETLASQALTNEANIFSRLGIECLVFGPGIGVGNSHEPNEFVKLDSLNQAIQFYKQIIERICL